MRSRLVALGVLAALLAASVWTLGMTAARLQAEGQAIGSSGQLTRAASEREQFVFVLSFELQTLMGPFAVASLLAIVAILAVLARLSQLRRRALAR